MYEYDKQPEFMSPQEMYDYIQSFHGGQGEYDYEDVMEEIMNMSEEETFGEWWDDYYQCGNNLFCAEYIHNNNVDGKTHVFSFYSDGSDTKEDDKVFGSADEALESTIDYDFLNKIAELVGKDPIK
jgi:hypothetical protein